MTGLDRLELLYLDHNRLRWLSGAVFASLPRLLAVTLHNNQLARLDLAVSPSPRLLRLVTLHNNRWQCSHHADCQWVTQAVDTFNRSAVRSLNKVNSRGSFRLSGDCVMFRSHVGMIKISISIYWHSCLPAEILMFFLCQHKHPPRPSL